MLGQLDALVDGQADPKLTFEHADHRWHGAGCFARGSLSADGIEGGVAGKAVRDDGRFQGNDRRPAFKSLTDGRGDGYGHGVYFVSRAGVAELV